MVPLAEITVRLKGPSVTAGVPVPKFTPRNVICVSGSFAVAATMVSGAAFTATTNNAKKSAAVAAAHLSADVMLPPLEKSMRNAARSAALSMMRSRDGFAHAPIGVGVTTLRRDPGDSVIVIPRPT